MTAINKLKSAQNKGFTLIELLIVIAILGTLAVVVLLALNPVQQLARTRDAGRSSGVTQLGHAVEALATVRGGVYPTDAAAGTCAAGATVNTGAAWVQNCLVATGEIQTVPSAIAYSSGLGGNCTGGQQQAGYCYDGNGTAAVVYSVAEALSNRSQCVAPTANPYFVYSSAAGRGGLWCGAAAPTAGLLGTSTGWR